MAPGRKTPERAPPKAKAERDRPGNKPPHRLQSVDENLPGAVGSLDEPTRADKHGRVIRGPAAARKAEAGDGGEKEE